MISIYKLQSVSSYCLIKQVNKTLGIRNSEIWLFHDLSKINVEKDKSGAARKSDFHSNRRLVCNLKRKEKFKLVDDNKIGNLNHSCSLHPLQCTSKEACPV